MVENVEWNHLSTQRSGKEEVTWRPKLLRVIFPFSFPPWAYMAVYQTDVRLRHLVDVWGGGVCVDVERQTWQRGENRLVQQRSTSSTSILGQTIQCRFQKVHTRTEKTSLETPVRTRWGFCWNKDKRVLLDLTNPSVVPVVADGKVRPKPASNQCVLTAS